MSRRVGTGRELVMNRKEHIVQFLLTRCSEIEIE